MLELVHLVLDLLEPAECREGRFMDRRARFEVNVLVQEAQPKTTRAHDVTTIGRLVTADETEDRALTSAVSTYKSDVFSRINL
jgi:hypothetical protein